MSDPIKRPNYFDHQFLKAADFTAEQAYHTGMRRLHNRLFHPWGIVSGLNVTSQPSATTATVSAGVAIDSAGHELVLAADTSSPDTSAFSGQTVFLTITYQEQITDANMRCAETPKVEIVAVPADPGLNLVLARLTLDSNGKINHSDAGEDPNSRRSAVASPDQIMHSIAFTDPANLPSAWPKISAGASPSTLQLSGGLAATGDLILAGDVTCRGSATFHGPVAIHHTAGLSQGRIYMSGAANGSSFSFNAHRSADNTQWVFPDPNHASVTMEIDDAIGAAPGAPIGHTRFEVWSTTPTNKTAWIQRFAINGDTGDVTMGLGGGSFIAGGDIVLQQSGQKLTSDVRLKEDIREISEPGAKLAGIRGVSYERVESMGGGRDIGVIAQEVEQVLPELVGTSPASGMKAVDYGKLNAVLVQAINQLRERVSSLETEIDAFTQDR